MKLIIFYSLFPFFIAPIALAENDKVNSPKKDNIEVKSDKTKKVRVEPVWEYPGIQFQKYLQQNPSFENNNQKQEISPHQHYPQLKQYSVIEDKKLEESKKLEEKNSLKKEEVELSKISESDEEKLIDHNYNHPSHEQLWK